MKNPLFLKLFILIFQLWSTNFFAQKENNTWYFGKGYGLNFNTSPPTALIDGKIDSVEGCSSYSDRSTGQLLFYTDGRTVWSADHNVMPNGTGLLGSYTSSQSALIIPFPQNSTKYFIFTTGAWGTGSFAYSMVDMTLNGGKGDVVSAQKNTILLSDVSEKLTATLHRNCDAYWVVVHKYNSDAYYSYLVDNTGLSNTPVISHSGVTHGAYANDALGCISISPNGKKLACAVYNLVVPAAKAFEIFDFDNSTGTVSNPIEFPVGLGCPYGTCFSPDNSKIYFGEVYGPTGSTTGARIYQFDLSSGVAASIIASQTFIGSGSYGHLELGPDGAIYFPDGNHLGAILNPNAQGTSCTYRSIYVNLPPGTDLGYSTTDIGLPNVVANSKIYPKANFTYSNGCMSIPTSFNCGYIGDYYLWDFGDPASGSANTSSIKNPSHAYSAASTYTITLIAGDNCDRDTSVKIIKTDTIPVFNTSPDVTLCKGQSTTLSATSGNYLYHWSTSATTSSITLSPTVSLTYTLTVAHGNCSDTKYVMVIVGAYPTISIVSNTSTCSKQPVTVTAIGATGYSWSTGSNFSEIYINPGPDSTTTYTLTAYTGNVLCSVTKNVTVTVIPIKPDAGPDIALCLGQSAVINASGGNKYLWDPAGGLSNASSANPTANPTITTIYTLTVSSGKCTGKDTLVIKVNPLPTFSLGSDAKICTGEDRKLNAGISSVYYLWSTNETTTKINISVPNKYYLTITDTNGCSAADTVNITEECASSIYIPTAFTPNDDGKNDLFYAYGNFIQDFNIQVFDHWGNLMYQTSNINQGWNGKYNGKDVQEDVYVWKVTTRDVFKNDHNYNGRVTLVR